MPLRARARDHPRRQVDAGEMRDERPERRAGEPGPAAEIERRGEPSHRPRPHHGVAAGAAVRDRRALRARRRSAARTGRTACAHSRATSPAPDRRRRAAQDAARRRSGPADRARAPRSNAATRAGAVAELRRGFAEREPGGGEARLRLGGLREQVGGGGEVAARGELAAERVTPIGNEIAGRSEGGRRTRSRASQ